MKKTLNDAVSDTLKCLALLSLPSLDDARLREVRRLMPSVDWAEFRTLLLHHRTWPCVFTNIRDYYSDEVPLSTRQWLQQAYLRNVASTQKLFQVQADVIRRLHHKGIVARAFKGLDLSQRLYKDAAKRHSKDVDILINEQDLAKAHRELIEAGYTTDFYEGLNAAQKKIYNRSHKDITYHAPNGVSVELHARLSGNSTSLTLQVEKSILVGLDTKQQKYDEFLYLCWHGTHSIIYRIKWLADIAVDIEQLTSKHPEFFEEIFRRAKELDSERMLLSTLVLVQILFNVEVPAKYIDSASSSFACHWIIERILNTLACPRSDQTIGARFEYYFLQILLYQKFRTIIGFFWQKAHPNVPDMLINRFVPPSLSFVFYLLRPLNVLYRLFMLNKKQ